MLLDELGTGTDPVEGAALAIAMVRSFCESGLKGGGFGGSRLLVATTHHGELKTLKYNDNRFDNASVEFDEEVSCVWLALGPNPG